MILAPTTGAVARRTARHSPSALSDTERSTAADSLSTRNAHVGPDPDTRAPERAILEAGFQHGPQSGLQIECGRLQIVAQRSTEQLADRHCGSAFINSAGTSGRPASGLRSSKRR